jgi:hypothetical protein
MIFRGAPSVALGGASGMIFGGANSSQDIRGGRQCDI